MLLLQGGRHHQQGDILQVLRGDSLPGLFDGHLGVHLGGQGGEVPHVPGIVAGDIVVVVGAVHQNASDQRRIGDVELEHSGKGVLGTTDGGHQGHIHSGLTCHVKGAGERNLCRSSRGQHAIASDFLDVHGVNHLTVHGIGHGLDGHIAAGVVVDLAGEVDRLATHHQLLIAHCAGDAGVDPLASPHGSGNGDVLVGLGDA